MLNGWYLPANPQDPDGGKAAWRAAYWRFIATYLRARFEANWCLSPEQSLLFHAGNRSVPAQLIVRSPVAQNKELELLHGATLLEVRAAMPAPQDTLERNGLRLYSLVAALIAAAPGFYREHPREARVVLGRLPQTTDLPGRLQAGGHSTIAGRLAGAFASLGRECLAERITQSMNAAGYRVIRSDPFKTGTRS